jgi:hypothetical protein
MTELIDLYCIRKKKNSLAYSASEKSNNTKQQSSKVIIDQFLKQIIIKIDRNYIKKGNSYLFELSPNLFTKLHFLRGISVKLFGVITFSNSVF